MNSFTDQRGSENWPTSSPLHKKYSHLNSLHFSFKAKESYICWDLVFICSQWGLLFWWRDGSGCSLQLPSLYLNTLLPCWAGLTVCIPLSWVESYTCLAEKERMKGREERVVKGVERGICWVERLDRKRRAWGESKRGNSRGTEGAKTQWWY